MSRGGARQGSGRKSEWSSGQTKAIRVPEDLAQEIIMFAKKLDRERRLEAQQKHLTSLLEDMLRVSPEDRSNWINKLSKDQKNLMNNINCNHISLGESTYDFSAVFQEDDTIQDWETTQYPNIEATIHPNIEATIFTIEGLTTVVQLSNGHQFVLPYQNGKFEYLDGGYPQQKISIVINDDGEVCLQISNIWNIEHLSK
jgi:hypothetical protein